jgi:hypothetical protein
MTIRYRRYSPSLRRRTRRRYTERNIMFRKAHADVDRRGRRITPRVDPESGLTSKDERDD